MNEGAVAVRTRSGEDKGSVKVEEFIMQALYEIKTKKR